ncbi:hypothetical protein R6Q57_006095 [Mikania cordata]
MTFAPQYRLITVEFLSTFVFRPRAANQPQADPDQPEVSFRLCGLAYAMSLAKFGNAFGLYTEEELEMTIYTSAIHTADDVIGAWWPRIGDEPFVRAARVTRIRYPLIRYLHRVIASSIIGRGMSQEWCTYGGCRYAGLCTGSFRQTDRAGHACRAEIPRVGLRFSLQKGDIWLPGPNDLHYRDEDPMPQPQQQPEQHAEQQHQQPPPEQPPAQDLPH